MKWKNRRQSTNVEDRTAGNDESTDLVPRGKPVWIGNRQFRYDAESMDRPVDRVKRELADKEITGEIPVPTPRPDQVTPGDWVEKKANFRGKKKK